MDESEFRYKDQTIHPRQAEILRNNYNVFVERAARATCQEYRQSCLDAAADAHVKYAQITGKYL